MRLTAWHRQQSLQVNRWYVQIARECSSGRAPPRPASPSGSSGPPSDIDEGTIDDLEIDEEDKTVAIKIPSTPEGYQD